MNSIYECRYKNPNKKQHNQSQVHIHNPSNHEADSGGFQVPGQQGGHPPILFTGFSTDPNLISIKTLLRYFCSSG